MFALSYLQVSYGLTGSCLIILHSGVPSIKHPSTSKTDKGERVLELLKLSIKCPCSEITNITVAQSSLTKNMALPNSKNTGNII